MKPSTLVREQFRRDAIEVIMFSVGEGQAILAGVSVRRLGCHAEGYQYQVCQDAEDLDREHRQRRCLLEGLWLNRPGSKAEERFLLLSPFIFVCRRL